MRASSLERHEHTVEIDLRPIEQVAGEKDDVGLETRSHLEQTAAKAGSVDRTKMQIANQHGTAGRATMQAD